jgi:hypothetical protein
MAAEKNLRRSQPAIKPLGTLLFVVGLLVAVYADSLL